MHLNGTHVIHVMKVLCSFGPTEMSVLSVGVRFKLFFQMLESLQQQQNLARKIVFSQELYKIK